MATRYAQTKELLDKIPNFPCLYRHRVTGTYYGIKKISGKKKSHSLDTSDRKIAERKLKEWIEDLDKIDAQASKTSLSDLLGKFSAINEGKAHKTKQTNQSIINVLKKTWKPGLDIQVPDIKPSHLSEWLGQHEGRLKNTSYNRYTGFLKQLFEIAVADKIIARSPFEGVRTKWKKPQKPIRRIPTNEQLEGIIKDVRSQKFSGDAENSADFLEFEAGAGVGQAEASAVTLGDIDWQKERIRFRRRKTGEIFYVPIYPHLKPLLERICKAFPEGTAPTEALFKIKDAKKALAAACKRLGFYNFSQRNLRQALIRRLWQSNVDKKLIAKWQGHRDGGALIVNTYTEVFSADDDAYERGQIEKIV